MILDPGIYTNIFPVEVPQEAIHLRKAPRSRFPDLRPLRQELSEENLRAWVYAAEDAVYGYGPDAQMLEKYGFQGVLLRLMEAPRLATRVIIEGFVDALREQGYEILFRKGHWQAYYSREYTTVAKGEVLVYRGYDLRSFFWKDIATQEIAFGFTVDVTWAFRDSANQALNLSQIKRQCGDYVVLAIGQVQGEYLPGSRRLNTEVARQRLQEHILPFVQKHSEFAIPCGGDAYLIPVPVRVVLGGEEQ